MNKRKSLLLLLLLASSAQASDLVYQFKNPSFSGQNAGSQWLTIDNQEASRKKTLQDKLEAKLKAEADAQANSILNRFMNNLQSRIYSQLAQQLTNNLFGQQGDAAGTFTLEGNTIDYTKNSDSITLRITDPQGNATTITVPTTGFKF
jgi:glutamate synthase domain-containing protein 3